VYNARYTSLKVPGISGREMGRTTATRGLEGGAVRAKRRHGVRALNGCEEESCAGLSFFGL